jgi:multisubunit Na+/H+ antiporter MnhC subunit
LVLTALVIGFAAPAFATSNVLMMPERDALAEWLAGTDPTDWLSH